MGFVGCSSGRFGPERVWRHSSPETAYVNALRSAEDHVAGEQPASKEEKDAARRLLADCSPAAGTLNPSNRRAALRHQTRATGEQRAGKRPVLVGKISCFPFGLARRMALWAYLA